MTTYSHLLDTNTISQALSGRSPLVDQRLRNMDLRSICISAVSYGEVRYGLAMKPGATRLAAAAQNFFTEFDIVSWTQQTGENYGELRAEMRRIGKALSALDMMIAAHALEVGATLVTSDRAFRNVPRLAVETWAAD